MEIQTTLVGVNFRPAEAREFVKQLAIGQELFLEAEPTNPYDANAVKVIEVFTDEDGDQTVMHLGYVARTDNAALAAALAEGQIFSCEVTGFTGTLKPTLIIRHIPEPEMMDL